MHNILTDQLIRMDTRGRGRISAPLPDVYAALMEDEVDAFPALRPHQRHAWHAFLVQLGAMALRRAGASEPPADPKAWAALIRGLTPDYPNDEPWHLVMDDITKPAFMQPPASSADKRKEYKTLLESPDKLDMLVTSRNHDLKSAVASSPGIDDWLFALLTVQTMDGYFVHYRGISRMSSGGSSRYAFSLAPSRGRDAYRLGIHVRRDIDALLERFPSSGTYPMTDSGYGLLWIMKWDAAKDQSLPLRPDPFYIEVCRRIRLYNDPTDGVYAQRAISDFARLEAKSLNGRTDDPWAPIDRKKEAALALRRGGFTYQVISDCLTGSKFTESPLLSLTDTERRCPDTMLLIARGVVRYSKVSGGSETNGYHERIIPLRRKVVQIFGRNKSVQDLGEIAEDRIRDIGKVQDALRSSIYRFVTDGKPDDQHKKLARYWKDNLDYWENKLDEIVDASFFDALQDEFEEDDLDKRSSIRDEWLLGVVKDARRILGQAQDSLPCRAIQRYRARVRSDNVFENRISDSKDGLPFLFQNNEEEA